MSLGIAFWACQFVVADHGFEVRNRKFKVAIFNLRVVGTVCGQWCLSIHFIFIWSAKWITDFYKYAGSLICRSSKSGKLNEVWKYKQPLGDNLKSCYANFSLSEIRYLPPSRHNSCHLSWKTHFMKLLLRGFHITKSRVSMSITISGDYKIKVNDCSTSTTTTLIRLCANLSPKWIKTASTSNYWLDLM